MRAFLFRACQALTLLILVNSTVFADLFGKNKVIATDFNWKVLNVPHFQIHYDSSLEPIIPRVSELLERTFTQVTRDLKFTPDNVTPFFIYPNHNDFEQTNIVDVGEGTGGVTEAFKNRLVIFNSGTESWLDQVIHHEFTHVIQFNILYGGFWKSARLLKSPLYPLWVIEGMAEYETGEIDSYQEQMYLRDAATSGRLIPLSQLHGFSHVKPHEVTLAYKEGEAALDFLSEEYGRDRVPQILNLLRERFEISSVIQDLTGLDISVFDKKFLEWLEDKYAIAGERMNEPGKYGERLTSPDELPQFNTAPAISPDGKKFAYISDRTGTEEVYEKDINGGYEIKLAGRDWRKLENVHTDGRAMSFSSDGRYLAFCGEKEQRDYLYLYDFHQSRLKKIRLPWTQARSPVFRPGGNEEIVIQGMQNGTNDLYIVSTKGRMLKRLTNDLRDENYPAFSPDGRYLVYSLEVRDEGVDTEKVVPLVRRDLYAMDLVTGSTRAITALPHNATYPAFTPDGSRLVFVSDRDGVSDLYAMDWPPGSPGSKSEVRRLTRGIGGFFSPAVSPDGKTLLSSVYRKGGMHIYKCDLQKLLAESDEKLEVRLPDEPVYAGNKRTAGESGVPGVSGVAHPYKMQASTDLFFPLLYYSTLDGLFLADFWQASDMFGNHNISLQLQYGSHLRFLDYNFSYTYSRFRPQFVFSSRGQTFYDDIDRIRQTKEFEHLLTMLYPIDRFHRFELASGSLLTEDIFHGSALASTIERNNPVIFSFVRDTTTGRYLVTTNGTRLRLLTQKGTDLFGGNQKYFTHGFDGNAFFDLGDENAAAIRIIARSSAGRDPQTFRVGGSDKLRGFPSGNNSLINTHTRFLMSNLELRAKLTYLNVNTWFLFPDVLMKALYGTLFLDSGYVWDRASEIKSVGASGIKSSVGFNLSVPSFILQTFEVNFTLQVAKRLTDGRVIWYFVLGPIF